MPLQPTGYEPVEHRVIAPIPNKAEGLKQDFVRAIHSLAVRILESCPQAAEALKDRLSPLYAGIRWVPFAKTFKEWVDADFPGIVAR